MRNDGNITAAEQFELKLAIQTLSKLYDSFQPADETQGQPCKECGTLAMPSTPLTPVICAACAFWHYVLECAASTHPQAWMLSVRANGCHYTLNNDQHGPEMTIRSFGGQQIVTTRLRTQGPIPERYIKSLPDNAIVTAGNPQRRPVGIVG